MPKLPPILFEDEHLLAFDKPTGLLVAPDRWDKELVNLMDMIHDQISRDIFNVHRLDRETSGVLLCAKSKSALDSVCAEFQSRRVNKRYVAITEGGPSQDEMTIKRAIAEDENQLGRMRVRGGGKPSETHIKVLTRFRGYCFLEAFPRTGRTHQIRVHLSAEQCPVLCDSMYGSPKPLLLSDIKRAYKAKEGEVERPLMGRLALHAQMLSFTHPAKGEHMVIESPIPKDFEISVKYLKRFAGL